MKPSSDISQTLRITLSQRHMQISVEKLLGRDTIGPLSVLPRCGSGGGVDGSDLSWRILIPVCGEHPRVIA